MATNIHNLIAAISPDTFCEPDLRKEVKKIVKEKGYLEAAKKAKPFKSDVLFDYDRAKKDALNEWGLKAPIETHEITYDSAAETMEPIYFWILDFLNGPYKEVEKINDNFVSSPGSGHFSELMSKATRMQEESIKILGSVNVVIKSILGLIYDLKEFKLRLEPYENYESKNSQKKYAALLSLKQMWMDNVDIKRGIGSINNMTSSQLEFVTLRDAFMASNSVDSIKKLDLNERVKRILIARVDEFFKWINESGTALRQRYNIEKNYLRSQVATVKLYARWVKPYLKSAQKLEQQESSSASLVTAFNTILMELTLLAKTSYDPADDVAEGILPKHFENATKRKYSPLAIVEFDFRGIPQKVGQHYTHGGKTTIKFTSYALNNQELKVLKEEMDKDDLGEAMKLIQQTTEDSLERIEEDVKEFLEPTKKESSEEKETDDTNPFTSLFSFLKTSKKKERKEDLSKGIKSDTSHEKVIRSQAIIDAREKCFTVFDIYKKAHRMPSHASPFEPL
jgi:hypothetical protein